MVRAAEHEAAVLAERVDEPHDLVSHVVDGAAREDLQDVHASVEGEPVAEVVLQALRLHSLRVRLDRIEQVDTELDQLRDERVDRAVAVVHHGHAALVRELRQPRVMRSHERPPGVRRDHQRVLRRDVVVEIDHVEAVAGDVQHAAQVLDVHIGQAPHDVRRKLGIDREVDQELLHPAQLPADLEHRADPEAHVVVVELVEQHRQGAEVPPVRLRPRMGVQDVDRRGALQRPRRKLLVGAESVLDALTVATPDVERRPVRVPAAPHAVRGRAVERTPPFDVRLVGRLAEHVVREHARVDLEVPQQRLPLRLDELGRADRRRIR